MSRAFVPVFRLTLVSVAVVAAFAGLLGRLLYLHVIDRPWILKEIESARRTVHVLEARRGAIFDSRGNRLASNRLRFDVGIDAKFAAGADSEKWPQLARLLEIPVEAVAEAAAQDTRQWVKLAEGVPESLVKEVDALGVTGVYGTANYSRVYPGGSLAAHVIGFINKENTPVTGVERHLDYYLRGQDGWRETERDGRSRELPQFRDREVAPTNGLNVALTIDQMAQHIVEREVERIAAEFAPRGATVIVSEPSTGSILAMASYPWYDPNAFWDYPAENLRNRALTDVFEPGSTFKIVAAAGALDERLVEPTDVFDTGISRVSYHGRVVRLPDDHHSYPRLTMREIVVKSSNRGAAQLGMVLGPERLYEYAAAFGFGQRSGIVLGGEVPGILHEPRDWDSLTITRLPMGHAVAATAIQVHGAMSVIANNGVLMEPRLVQRIYDDSGNERFRFQPLAKRRVIDASTARELARMLVEVVSEDGTAQRAAVTGFAVAGKTGTTQKIVNGRYSSEHHVASFSGFLPAEDPALVITVIVDDPQLAGTGYGGVIAAPAFANIAAEMTAYLGIRPSAARAPIIALDRPLNDRTRRLSN